MSVGVCNYTGHEWSHALSRCLTCGIIAEIVYRHGYVTGNTPHPAPIGTTTSVEIRTETA